MSKSSMGRNNGTPKEVPDSLKQLVRSIVRSFYSREHSLIMDMLVRNTIMKEDDICERLLFERKQLRTLLHTLQSDLLLRTKMELITDAEEKSTRINYYYIDYKLFVNVVKYRLDMMRRRLEAEERETTSRASFKCLECGKTYTDLEVNWLLDPLAQTLLCMHCKSEVVEEEDMASRADARALMSKFHDHVREPIDNMLRECDDIHLTSDILEPDIRPLEPLDSSMGGASSGAARDSSRAPGVWSGDLTRNSGFGATENSVTINFGAAETSGGANQAKERPKWLTESTVTLATDQAKITSDSVANSVTQTLAPGRVPNAPTSSSTGASGDNLAADEVMQMLLVCERKHLNTPMSGPVGDGGHNSRRRKKKAAPPPLPSGGKDSSSGEEESSSGDEDGASAPSSKRRNPPISNSSSFSRQSQAAAPVSYSDNDGTVNGGVGGSDNAPYDQVYEVTIGGRVVSYEDVTKDIIMSMTPSEKQEYIQVGRQIYEDLYM